MEGKTRYLVILGMIIIAIASTWFRLGAWFFSSEQIIEGVYGTEAMFYETLDNDYVQCGICYRECIIGPGKRGFCQARENQEGVLYSLVYGKPSALQLDPIEKEPMFHKHPGTTIFCVGTASCNFRCTYCHNWSLSQVTIEEVRNYWQRTPEELVREAKSYGAKGISFTYNEPTILYEYVLDTARLAQEAGLDFIFHTNGSMSPEPLKKLLPYVDGVTVDLKGFTSEFYHNLPGSSLEPVLNTLQIISESDVWLEIVNLVIPQHNDDPETIKDMCLWIVNTLGQDIPLHFTRFSPSYRLTGVPPTPLETLETAHTIAKEAGLQYVYIGNYPGHANNSTYCPQCRERIIERYHFSVYDVHIEQGHCAFCAHPIPGLWQ